jgi:diacylglycerol kinase (ATP)
LTIASAGEPCDTVFIVNPNANGGKAGSIWKKKVLPLLKKDSELYALLGSFQIFVTNSAEEAVKITRQFAERRTRKIVAVGGDDTIHNVVKGLLVNGTLINADIHVGVIPLGAGNDFSLTLGIERDYQKMLEHLLKGTPHPTDIGYVKFQTDEGAEVNYFLNTASIGISAEITSHLIKKKKSFTTFNYALAAFKVYKIYEDPTVTIQINESDPFQSTLKTAIIANGNFCGKGMKMAPQAKVDDGQIDLILFTQGKITELHSMMSKLQKGNHLGHEGITLETGNIIKISPIDESNPISLEVNGFVPGKLPATFSVIPQQIYLIYKKATSE